MAPIIQISRDDVLKILNWQESIAAVEAAMLSVTEERAIQNPRIATIIPGTHNVLLSMPGYVNHEQYHALTCKLVTYFPNNFQYNAPTISASIILFNEINGAVEAVIDGTEITLWRTAAASVVATKYMRSSNKQNNILAILGAGAQAKIHAIAFQNIFRFNEVRIWNRNYEKAKKLCDEININSGEGRRCVSFKSVKECVDEADVLITTTSSTTPLIRHEWLKKEVHINAVGFNKNIMELDERTYKSATVFVDHLAGIEHELKHLTDMGIIFKGEIGALINKTLPVPNSDETTIFQSLGMAVEDSAMARLVYEKHMEINNVVATIE